MLHKNTKSLPTHIPVTGYNRTDGDSQYGDININDKIIVNGYVKKVKDNHYLISAFHFSDASRQFVIGRMSIRNGILSATGFSGATHDDREKTVTAIILDTEYTGKNIEVFSDKVIVDGVKHDIPFTDFSLPQTSVSTDDVDNDSSDVLSLEDSPLIERLSPTFKKMFASLPVAEHHITISTYRMNGWEIGGVAIDGRIFTNGMVKALGNNQYVIWPTSVCKETHELSSFLNLVTEATVRATIDGKEYRGAEILVNGKQVNIHATCNFAEYAAGLNPAGQDTSKHTNNMKPKSNVVISGVLYSNAKNPKKFSDLRQQKVQAASDSKFKM